MAYFTENNTVHNLSEEQLKAIACSNNTLLLSYIESTVWDVERIRIIMELGIQKANELLGKI